MKARSSRKKNSFHIARIVIIALVFVGVGMLLPRAFNLVGSIIMMPIHSINQWLETSSQTFPTFVRSREALQNQIDDLEQKLVIAESSSITLSRLTEENNSLRALLSIDGSPRIAAAVIARPNDLPYDILQIDRGWEAGIKEGAAVYIGADQFVGIISHVTGDYSFVELLTSPTFEATAFIEGSNVIATIEGYGGGVARVRVPQGVALTVGDLVHVLTVNPGAFGRISYIETTPSQPEQYGYITPEIPLQSIHYVAVDTKPIQKISAEEAYKKVDTLLSSKLIIDGVNTINAIGTSTPTSSAISS